MPGDDMLNVKIRVDASEVTETLERLQRPKGKYHAIRCFEGDAKPQAPFWRMRNAVETGTGEAEVEFYGPISEYVWSEEDTITPQLFKDQLYKVGNGGPVRLRVNSPGGDMVAASVIRSILTDYPGPVTAQIDGIAASAAVVVVMAASKTEILDSAFMVIHDPSVQFFLAELNITDLEYILNSLQSAKSSIVSTYAAKTGLSETRLERMLTETTWMSANEAVSLGFADTVVTGGNQSKNAIKPNMTNSLRQLGHVPSPLLNLVNVDEAQRRAEQRFRDEVKLFFS
jgi:ATP-dependent protease ClpP protease subunit